MKILMCLYPGGQAAGTHGLLSCAEQELGVRELVEDYGHELITTHDRGPLFDDHLRDADIVVGTPFYPVYFRDEWAYRLDPNFSPKLKFYLQAGVGSDNVSRDLAAERGMTIAEVTGSNVDDVAEEAVMDILIAVRDFITRHNAVYYGMWDIAGDVQRSHRLMGKTVGIVGIGRIGQRVAERLAGFHVRTLYYDPDPESPKDYEDRGRTGGEIESEYKMERRDTLDALLSECDVITVHCPLIDGVTRGLFNREKFEVMRRGAEERGFFEEATRFVRPGLDENRVRNDDPLELPILINTARGAIVEHDDLLDAMERGIIGNYGGDVWVRQPAPPDDTWRYMAPPHAPEEHIMVHHTSGTTLEAQGDKAAGIYDMLEAIFAGEPLRKHFAHNLIVDEGEIPNIHKA